MFWPGWGRAPCISGCVCPHWAGASTRWSGRGGARAGHQPLSSSATLEVNTRTGTTTLTQETVCQVAKVKVEENPTVTLTFLELLTTALSSSNYLNCVNPFKTCNPAPSTGGKAKKICKASFPPEFCPSHPFFPNLDICELSTLLYCHRCQWHHVIIARTPANISKLVSTLMIMQS